MKVEFLSVAESEIAEAIQYYNERQPGLGHDFYYEFKVALNRLVSFPNAWPIFADPIRRILLQKFPYGVLYKVGESKTIIIYGLMHLRSCPNTWQSKVLKY